MSKRLRTLLLCSFAIALVAVAVVVGSLSGGTVPPVPLPNPNGYDDFLQAGGLVSGDVGNSSTFDGDKLREFVAANAEPLRWLHLGLTRKSSFPTDAGITNLNGIFSDFPKLKSLAWVLAAEGRVAELDDRPADAARSYLGAIRFGNEISRGGFIINRLVGIACEAIGGSRLAALVPKLNCEQASVVINELERLDDAGVTWDEIRQNENRFARYQLRKVFNPITWVISRWQVWTQRQVSEQKHNRIAARLRLLTVELALRCYRIEHGYGPGRLEQLVPDLLNRVPLDPFGGQRLIYHVSGTNWLLYSVGPDGVDDGGRPAGGAVTNKGDLILDSHW